MAEKRMNPLLIGGVVVAVLSLSLVMCTDRKVSHQPIQQVPGYDSAAKREDGDTQTDTIRALQAYAREAVSKADALHASTEDKMEQVLKNRQQLSALVHSSEEAQQQLADTKATVSNLEHTLASLQRELADVRSEQAMANTPLNEEGLPIGFGFDEHSALRDDPNQGQWFNPIDWVEPASGSDESNRFTGLLHGPTASAEPVEDQTKISRPEVVIEPVYTLPKDATLTDGLALTALIGRIPVEGQTPDPYPVKIYIGKENLLANGHELPEVEGMIFSGLGFGDWNLSCVSARLMSATFIFEDGSIVNHSSTHTNQGQPLGYISDPSGVPCVAGRFVTNAPAFLSQRVGLAAISAAGSAYAEAQQQRQTSALSGTSTSTVIGDINKLATGEAVQSATDEVSQWLLARQKQSFDAVVVNPGAAVSVHLDRSLPLDKNSIIRRLRYAKGDKHVRADLD